MNLKTLIGFIVLAIFLFGLGMTKSVIPSMVFTLFLSPAIIAMVLAKRKKFEPKKLWNQERDVTQVVIALTSIVIKSSGKQEHYERKYVELMLDKNFNEKTKVKYLKILDECLEKNLNVKAICLDLNENLSVPSKIQLVQFVIGIAVADGVLYNAEYQTLLNISRLLQIPFRTFRSILAIYNFKTEEDHKNWEKRFYEKKQPNASSSALKKAFDLLELEENASVNEIKKAYRKLAKVHHPDRVLHMGKEFQKMAKERFQKIQDAYELIKSKKGFA